MKTNSNNHSILDVKNTAAFLGVSAHTIYRLIAKAKLPAVKVGKQWRFHKQSIIQWIANGSSSNQLEYILKNAQIKKDNK